MSMEIGNLVKWRKSEDLEHIVAFINEKIRIRVFSHSLANADFV